MNYKLLKEVLDLVEEFELTAHKNSIEDFKSWISYSHNALYAEPDWEGKENGRSAESVINTLLVHLNRYARTYSRSAIFGSGFSTQEEFIYLINLKVFGEMTKIDLIRKNVHEKPAGMQIINRLIAHGWVDQVNSETDKRSKILKITTKGLDVLNSQMDRIRQATEMVTGNLTPNEKLELIRLLGKLDAFHQLIYDQHIPPKQLLDQVVKRKNYEGETI